MSFIMVVNSVGVVVSLSLEIFTGSTYPKLSDIIMICALAISSIFIASISVWLVKDMR